jgi:succinate-semialdehyde dehydrogenase/glutarate-semialdehyde dehydrogenase
MQNNNILQNIIKKYGCDSSQKSFEVINPATNEKIITLLSMSGDDTNKLIEKSLLAQKKYTKLPPAEKSKLLRDLYNLIIKNIDELAEIITIENGKPLAEAKGEVNYGASFIEWYAEKAKRIDSRVFQHNSMANVEGRVDYQPVGVVAAITPWNFPFAMITRKLAPALASGCSMVIKPSELTPLSALALRELAIEVGFDKDLFTVVYGDSKIIGAEMTSNKIVKKITFTGSTNVGKLLLSQSADSVKKISLELGGNAPLIIFDSADIQKAVTGIMIAKFRNAGQVCIAPNRVFVQESVKMEFIKQLVSELKKVKVGNGLEVHTTMGPLINIQAVEKAKKHMADAVGKGANIVFGGESHSLGGTFFEPTILDNMTDDMLTSCEEIFAPVVAVFSFTTEDEVIQRANNTPYGLASYFFTEDYKQIQRVRNQIEAGMVGINTGMLSVENAPFGGIKESGLGREGSDEGIYEFMEAKYSLQNFG